MAAFNTRLLVLFLLRSRIKRRLEKKQKTNVDEKNFTGEENKRRISFTNQRNDVIGPQVFLQTFLYVTNRLRRTAELDCPWY